MSRRSHRRRKKRGPRPVAFFSRRWFEKAAFAMDHGGGFNYDGRTIEMVPRREDEEALMRGPEKRGAGREGPLDKVTIAMAVLTAVGIVVLMVVMVFVRSPH